MLTHLILRIISSGRSYCYHHFIDEKTETQRNKGIYENHIADKCQSQGSKPSSLASATTCYSLSVTNPLVCSSRSAFFPSMLAVLELGRKIF